MQMEIPEYVSTVINQLNTNGFECFIVGGAVRNTLLGLPVHDYDLTTNALPEQTKQIFQGWKTIDTGIKHGTVVVMSNHHPLEITTYRKDAEYKDHRHPDTVIFTSALQEDCARRDFTINALCYHPETGVLDFYEGQKDLQAGRIRCIRDPQKRFEEDALRILRAIRFAARLQFTIEPATAEALHTCKDLLKCISIERIHEETDGLLIAAGCAEMLRTYKDVLTVYIPEFAAVSPEKWENILCALERCRKNAVLRMTVLLSVLSRPEADKVIERMKYSNEDSRTIQTLLKLRTAPVNTRIDLRHLLSVLPFSYEDYFSFRCALDPELSAQDLTNMCRRILEDKDCISLKQLAVNGRDLTAMGIKGKAISASLNTLLELVICEQIENKKEALLDKVRELPCSTF